MNRLEKTKTDKEPLDKPAERKIAKKMPSNKQITGSGKKLGVYRMPNTVRKSTESIKNETKTPAATRKKD